MVNLEPCRNVKNKSTALREREEIHRFLVLLFSKISVITTDGGPQHGSYLTWNWFSICETFEYSLEGICRVITVFPQKVGKLSSWSHSGIKLSCALYIDSTSLLSIRCLRNGCRLVSSLTFSEAQISSCPL